LFFKQGGEAKQEQTETENKNEGLSGLWK